jgi:alkanesulfonate monooxygenase SsuD/methylene tetrahydromethanopterin reductase-like flavin-dependent oxidoreductase (luciferase family)
MTRGETCHLGKDRHDRLRPPGRFGYFLIPNAADPLLATAQQVERLGLDYVGVQDHPYQRRFVDTWTLLAMIAATTTRVRVFPDVANLPLRQPAVLAKAAASLDLLSGGRLELGLDAGGFWDAVAAYGAHAAPRPRSPGSWPGSPRRSSPWFARDGLLRPGR